VIGIWSGQSAAFLCVMSVVTLVALGLPLLFVPLRWARALLWELPERSDLAIYLGRSLGGVAIVLAIFGFLAAGDPGVQPFFYQLMIGLFAMMIATHVYGAMRRIQPITETLEILLWAAFLALALCFYPG
jgi:hypothetical protein